METTDDKEMDEEFNIEEEEKRIIRIIKRIKSNRNRTSYQNILEFANLENNKLKMDSKVLLNNLIQRNIIFDLSKGKLDKESFKLVVVEETSDIVVENPVEETDFQKGGNEDTTHLIFY